MLPGDQNNLLCRTDPGSPAGELMRRYWQPVGTSSEVTPGGKPHQVRVMGEDLVLFRDDQGRPGLVGLHCSHRLTSLAYGRVEDGGIRCPFHGWLYDVEGHCLAQPAEPEGSSFKDRVRHPAYPCEELGGLIFAYMGPADKRPLLPRYEVLVRQDGTHAANHYVLNSNYLQNLEGALDTAHFCYLHMNNWSKVKLEQAKLPKPKIELETTDYGLWNKTQTWKVNGSSPTYAHFFMPVGFFRIEAGRAGAEAYGLRQSTGHLKKYQSWYVPIDDTHTRRFVAGFAPNLPDGQQYEWPLDEDYDQPGPENDYFRDYEHVDTISGIPTNAPGLRIKGLMAQDNMVNESQGPIEDRTREHLGAHDQLITIVRHMLLNGIGDVQGGRDPKHIIRDVAQNTMVYVAGEEELERA
ncbi:MAG: phthalate 4,5-dioxygenase [Chloroflexi bacterium]|nr:phthalate 4,5-dioxygenase [Chloroflexota bacterium]